MRAHRPLALTAVVALVAALAVPAGAYPRPGATERISVSTEGLEARGPYEPNSIGDVSDDGRYVVFGGWSRNLAPDDLAAAPIVRPWIFLRDRETGQTELLSWTHDGKVSAGGERAPRITPDGRFVTFWSTSPLTTLPVNNSTQIYVRDREAGTVEMVSVNDAGEAADAPGTFNRANSFNPEITPDGRYIVFHSRAANLVESDKWNGRYGMNDVFLRDRELGTTERVSVATGGAHIEGSSGSPKISDDGRYVAFESTSEDLGHSHPNENARSVFIHDRETVTTTMVSVASDGTPGDGWSSIDAMTPDGRYILFTSDSTNLVPRQGGIDPFEGVLPFNAYVHDRVTGLTERVSVSSDGTEGNASSSGVDISDDGRTVSLSSSASNLVPNDTNGRSDVFTHDRVTGVTERVSVGQFGEQSLGQSVAGRMNADGSLIGFNSQVSKNNSLTPGIERDNPEWDVFLRDRGPVLGLRLRHAVAARGKVTLDGRATFSGMVLSSTETEPAAGLAADLFSASLTGASLVYRHEHESLQARIDVADVSALGSPGVVYGLRFTTPTGDWEARTTMLTPDTGRSTLHRCEEVCSEEATLAGSFGTTGPQVRITIPHAAVGLEAGQAITGIEAYTALLDAPLIDARELASATLPDVEVPSARVAVDVLDEHGDPVASQDLPFDRGEFMETLEFTDLPTGVLHVRARACLGEVCSGPPTTPMER